jgi:exonuclease SbcD
MKILHTSDWHLGRSLYGRKRYREFAAFLDWLIDCIQTQQVDVLLVAGDVFDTATPSNRAQELYYRFLCKVAASCCRHVVVIGGNHDSPSFLNAPAELLRALDVHVVGAMTEHPEDEVIVLRDDQDRPEAIVCAVPYLRDRDVRTVRAGETIEEKGENLARGIRDHYHKILEIAECRRQDVAPEIPLLVMGHLFTAGGSTVEGDGVRELYVGSLAHVGTDIFPASIDYLALGHLHTPQRVNRADHMRYSGAPIAMGFAEAIKQKKVILVDFAADRELVIREIPVPCFQPLERISGTLDEILARISELQTQQSTAWLEIEYTGGEIIANLRELLDEVLTGSANEVLRIQNRRVVDRVIGAINEEETLDDLNDHDVFVRCLDTHEVPEAERVELLACYQEIITSLTEEDRNAE